MRGFVGSGIQLNILNLGVRKINSTIRFTAIKGKTKNIILSFFTSFYTSYEFQFKDFMELIDPKITNLYELKRILISPRRAYIYYRAKTPLINLPDIYQSVIVWYNLYGRGSSGIQPGFNILITDKHLDLGYLYIVPKINNRQGRLICLKSRHESQKFFLKETSILADYLTVDSSSIQVPDRFKGLKYSLSKNELEDILQKAKNQIIIDSFLPWKKKEALLLEYFRSYTFNYFYIDSVIKLIKENSLKLSEEELFTKYGLGIYASYYSYRHQIPIRKTLELYRKTGSFFMEDRSFPG